MSEMLRKIAIVLKRRAKLFVLLAFIFFVIGIGLWLFIGEDAEQVAVGFYKAAWVEGDPEKAASFGPSGANALDSYAKGPNVPIMIAEYPSKSSIYRTYYIYRPSDNSMFAVQLVRHKGSWVVAKYDQKDNYSIQTLDQVFPQLQGKWKEIQP